MKLLLLLTTLLPWTMAFDYFIQNGLSLIPEEGHTQQFNLVFHPQDEEKTKDDLVTLLKDLDKIKFKSNKKTVYAETMLSDARNLITNLLTRLHLWNKMSTESVFHDSKIDEDCTVTITPPAYKLDKILKAIHVLLALAKSVSDDFDNKPNAVYKINNLAHSVHSVISNMYEHFDTFLEDALYTLNKHELTSHLFTSIITNEQKCTDKDTFNLQNNLKVLMCDFENNDLICKVAFQQTTKFHNFIHLLSVPYLHKQLCDDFLGYIDPDTNPERKTFDLSVDVLYQYQKDQYIGNSLDSPTECLSALKSRKECDIIDQCNWCDNTDDYIETVGNHILLLNADNMQIKSDEESTPLLETIPLPALLTYTGTVTIQDDIYQLNINRNDDYSLEHSSVNTDILQSCYEDKESMDIMESFFERHQVAITFAICFAIIITCISSLCTKTGKSVLKSITKDKQLESWKKQRENKNNNSTTL